MRWKEFDDDLSHLSPNDRDLLRDGLGPKPATGAGSYYFQKAWACENAHYNNLRGGLRKQKLEEDRAANKERKEQIFRNEIKECDNYHRFGSKNNFNEFHD